MRPADVRAFVPVEAEPAQILDRLLRRPALHARRIDILHPQNDLPTARADREPGQQISSRVTDVLGSRWGWSEAAHERLSVGHYRHRNVHSAIVNVSTQY